MMRIAVLNFEEPWLVIVSTSLIRGLKKAYPNAQIIFFVNQESEILLRYDRDIETVNGYTTDNMIFDIVINLSPTLEASNLCQNLEANNKYGFIDRNSHVCAIDKSAQDYYESVFANKTTKKCILQLIYRVANLKWHGEGYKLNYYPKNKTCRSDTGIVVEDDVLREYVKSNLKLSLSRMKCLSLRSNLHKKIDEINKCTNIVTDDLFILHASICLRKNVQFLDKKGLGYNIEFFGKGNHHRILHDYKQLQTE